MGIPSIVSNLTKALALTIICLCTGAGALIAAEPDGPDTLITLKDAVEYQLIAKIDKDIRGNSNYNKKLRKQLKQFYEARDRQLLWFDDNGLTPRAKAVIAEIKKGEKYGMKVSDIRFPEGNLKDGNGTDRAAAEIQMSRAVLTFTRYAKAGRTVPQKISRFLDNSPVYPEPLEVMKSVASTNDMPKLLLSFQPKHEQFWALQKQLTLLRNAAGSEKTIVKIPARGDTIEPFDRHQDIILLRQRLNVPVPQRNGKNLYPANSYDSELVKAVKNFQSSHNVRATGIINKATRAKFNGKKPNKEKQLLANMERWRWMPTEFGKTYVRINIPEYKVRVTKNNKIVHTERVITGKRTNPTPSFSDEMETVVFNPYWNVPQSIIWNEMHGVAPKGYQSRVVNGRVFIRQPPGPRNALGRIKFLFPNKHSVYMHDTPNKSLFNKKVRAFSHGCMRLRDPLKMAEVLLNETGISRKTINKKIGSRRNQTVVLKSKIPVHVTYFTMWSNKDGSISYFNDIYGHDKKVIAALEGRPMNLEPKKRIAKRKRVSEQQQFFSYKKKKNGNYNNGFISLFFN